MNPAPIYYLVFTKNEERTIAETLHQLRSSASLLGDQDAHFAVVDDSSDGTRMRAKEAGVSVVPGGGRGLGHAYQVGVRWALDQGAKYIFTLDGDGQTDFGEIPQFWQEMVRQNADLVLGSRFLKEGLIQYEYPRTNRWGVRLLATYLTLTSGVRITDSHGGIRLMNQRAAESLDLRGHHTYVQESILCAVRRGLKVIEIQSVWNRREHGQSRVVRSKWTYVRKMAGPLFMAGLQTFYMRVRGDS